QRWMLWIAERQFASERELLRHVGVNVLAALGHRAIKRPERHVAEENHNHRALAPGGVGERIEQPIDEREAAAAALRHSRHCNTWLDPSLGGQPMARGATEVHIKGGTPPLLCRISRRC